MKHTDKNRGFTLLEMLIVIAIIAVLVSVSVPVVTNSSAKAKATTDAANMRAVYAVANAILYGSNPQAAIEDIAGRHVPCKSFPDAKLEVVFNYPAFVEVYFVDGGSYYSRDYFAEVAQAGQSALSTDMPSFPEEARWYVVGEGGEVPVP